MAKKKSSAEKRHRKSEERRLRNKSTKSAVKTSVKKFVALAQKKDPNTDAALREMIKKLDTAAGKGIITKNAAARKKSRMTKYYNTVKAAQ
ncbi:MAG: 30S ribosomal protein S20 [Treponema sp.]|nr:30S ribosomal protein S20 [Treponema sp.]